MSGGLVVVGSGPAALAAATAYRKHDHTGQVELVSADQAAPYNRPPLSKDYLRGESADDDLSLEDASFYEVNRIQLRLNTVVTDFDPQAHVVTLANDVELPYDKLVLATGARPKPLPVAGARDPRLYKLRSLADARRLRQAASTASHAVVLGSGFIGCEAAASLALRGIRVTLVTDEEVAHAARLGDFAGKRITRWLEALGVTVLGGADVTQIEGGRSVQVSGRGTLHSDLVLVAGGVSPDGALAASAGLKMDGGRIVVDASMTSSEADVLAAGDVALAGNSTAGRSLTVEHWADAESMGAVAGTVAAGNPAEWDSVPGFWSQIGDHTLKYAAWGDGFDQVRPVDHGQDAFTVWYSRDDVVVGVLTHHRDDDYDHGTGLIAAHASSSEAGI